MSCENASSTYEANCLSGSGNTSEKYVIFERDSTAILLREGSEKDSVVWSPSEMPFFDFERADTPVYTIALGKLDVAFYSPDSIIGYVIQKSETSDTIVTFNADTKKEEIQIVKNEKIDTLSSCPFTKVR